jgi:hypothetical protein
LIFLPIYGGRLSEPNPTKKASRLSKLRRERSREEIVADNTHKPYCELGKMLDDLARERGVRGPYNIANHVENVTGHEVSGQLLSKYLYGEYVPKREFVRVFAEAFTLTPRERSELAWVYTYDSQPKQERLAIVELTRAADNYMSHIQEM